MIDVKVHWGTYLAFLRGEETTIYRRSSKTRNIFFNKLKDHGSGCKSPQAAGNNLQKESFECAALKPGTGAHRLQKSFQLERRIAELSYEAFTTPGHGLPKDCAISMQGFRNMLALRAEIEGQWGGIAPSPERYLDLSY